MRRNLFLIVLVLGLFVTALTPSTIWAHRPYFEGEDIGPDDPWLVQDPSISTAIYATLESSQDVDYFAFEGLEQEVVLLQLTIPQIEGQDDFAPTMALIGPGLPAAGLPERVAVPDGAGMMVIEPPPGPANTFFEPFSRTSYWERQEKRVTLPAGGRYVVAVWHPDGEVGRYTFVIGEKERLGGDPAFPIKMRRYWKPVKALAVEPTVDVSSAKHSCGGWLD